MSGQVKSKQRVADHGEVFTNEREVKAMVNLVWDKFPTDEQKIKASFLEPACGDGNFLVEILERKLKIIEKIDQNNPSQTSFEKNLITALTSVYGIELLKDNARECRKRLGRLVLDYYPKSYKQGKNYSKMCKNIVFILSKNIICGDALNFKRTDTKKDRKIMVVEWLWCDEKEHIRTQLYSLFQKVNYHQKTNSQPRIFHKTDPVLYLDLHRLVPEILKEEKEISKPQEKKSVQLGMIFPD